MHAAPSPIESEFATRQEAQEHDAWFRRRVLASLADTRPTVPHDQVLAETEAVIQEAEQREAAQSG